MDWFIGASPVCDLVIDEPAVSSRHCQIAVAGSNVLLRDLDSTNGTWVNGKRISGSTAIKPGDSVRLGSSTQVAWSRIQKLIGSRVIRIGREPDNDVVIADEKVSGHHARLLIEKDRLTLIDLDSGNGTSVGTPDQTISRAEVTGGSTVFFASNQFRVSDLLRAGASGTDTSSRRDWYRHPAAWIATVVSLAVLGMAVALFRHGERPADAVSAAPAEPSPPAAVRLTPQQRLEQALYAIVVKSAETEPGLRVGTAWAVTDTQLATSGSVVMFLQDSAVNFPIVLVQSVADGRQWPVARLRVHKTCRANADRMTQLAEQIQQRRAEFADLTEPAEEPSNEETPPPLDKAELDRLTNQILELEDRWFLATEEMIHFDVGVLETTASLARGGSEVVLPLATHQPARRAQLRVCAAAFFPDASVVTEPSRLPLAAFDGSLDGFVPLQTGGVQRLVVKSPVTHTAKNWFGAPALNAAGEVVGLYSRPTPSPDPDTPPSGAHCDIVPVARVRELFSAPE